MKGSDSPLSRSQIFRFWLPLEATWLMMGLEGPFLTALIARLPSPKFNLAAYGVAFSLAMIAEAPIIMMLSASNVLVTDRLAFLKLRRFTYWLNAGVSAGMIFILVPPVFHLFSVHLIGLPTEVARLTWKSVLLLLPWPAAIGYRRFYQGLLIRSGSTRSVAIGTLVRLGSMAGVGLLLSQSSRLAGASIGGAALASGVVAEAVASRFMARSVVRRLLSQPEAEYNQGHSLTYSYIWRFYLPLALTSFLQLAVHPLVTFFVGRSRMPIESLAVIPVINALAFVFRSFGMAYQESVIALLGAGEEGWRPIRRFALSLGILSSLGMAAVTGTPLQALWFGRISGLSPELAGFAMLPALILSGLPFLESLLSLQRGRLMKIHRTGVIIAATAMHIGVLCACLFVLIGGLHGIGARAVALSHLAGYAAANGLLLFFWPRHLSRKPH